MSDAYTSANQAAWDRTSRKDALEHEDMIAFLRAGGVCQIAVERTLLGDISGVERAVNLQCSNGATTLSLLNLGVKEVVGVDLSAAMLDLARRKSDALGANATWIQADVLNLPESLRGTADLVGTGGGALPWVQDIDRWAISIASVLRPNGTCHRRRTLEAARINARFRALSCHRRFQD